MLNAVTRARRPQSGPATSAIAKRGSYSGIGLCLVKTKSYNERSPLLGLQPIEYEVPTIGLPQFVCGNPS